MKQELQQIAEFKLYLYGIEMSMQKKNSLQNSRSNCTFMELK